MVMPGMPAPPRNRAYSDQTNAASVPIEMSVSMVAARWRALVQAARWKGSAPQTTTGPDRVSTSHCQLVNCSAGIIDSSRTGADRTADTTNRCRSAAVSSKVPGSSVSASVEAVPLSPMAGTRRAR